MPPNLTLPPKKQTEHREEKSRRRGLCLPTLRTVFSITTWHNAKLESLSLHRMLRGLPHQSHGEEKNSSERLNFQVTVQPKHSRPSYKPQG